LKKVALVGFTVYGLSFLQDETAALSAAGHPAPDSHRGLDRIHAVLFVKSIFSDSKHLKDEIILVELEGYINKINR